MGSAHIVVDTGVWIFGKHIVLPAGTISRVDTDEQKVYVDRSKDEIKSAPEFDKGHHAPEPAYYAKVGEYYGRL